MNDGFIFYGSFYEALAELPDDERLSAYDAVCKYAITGEEPELSGVVAAIFKLIRPQIDANQKRRENGRTGGRPKTEQKPNDNQTITKSEPNHNQTITKGEPSNNQTVTKGEPKEKGKEKVKEKEKVNIESMSYDIDRRTDVTTEDVDQVIQAWNTLPSSIPKVSKIITGSQRDKMLRARIREYGLTPVILAVEKIRASDFLCGRNKKGWTISFDWFIGPQNFPKVHDGNYDARSGTTEAAPMSGRDYLLSLIHGGEDERDRDEQDPVHAAG